MTCEEVKAPANLKITNDDIPSGPTLAWDDVAYANLFQVLIRGADDSSIVYYQFSTDTTHTIPSGTLFVTVNYLIYVATLVTDVNDCDGDGRTDDYHSVWSDEIEYSNNPKYPDNL